MLEGIASIRVYLPQDAEGNPELIMKIFKQTSLGLNQGYPSRDELEGKIICCINFEYETLHNLEKIVQAQMWLEVKNAFELLGIDLPIQLIEN